MQGGEAAAMETDENTYRRFLAGEEGAFDEMLQTYHESLIFFIRRYVPSLDEAEDIAEDCFVELLVHPHRYRFRTGLKTYLFAIARHKAIDRVRRAASHPTLPLDALDISAGASEDYRAFEGQMLRDERRRAVNRAVEELPEAMRTVIHLLYFEEMSYEAAGKVMGKSRKQIENLAYRARGVLRDRLTKEGWNE